MGGGIGGGIGLGGSSEPVTWAKPTARTSTSFSNIGDVSKERFKPKTSCNTTGHRQGYRHVRIEKVFDLRIYYALLAMA